MGGAYPYASILEYAIFFCFLPDVLKFPILMNSHLVCNIYMLYKSFVVYLDDRMVSFCATNIYITIYSLS